jgi:outer membrane protein OmpA-like peptidoglycan-associated protein
MHGRLIAAGAALVLASSLAGCSVIEQNPRAAKGTVIGAATGAGTGAAIGGIVGGGKGAGKGAAIGAVVGAIGGGAIGAYMDRQARDMEVVLAEQDRLRREQERLQVVLASDVLFESGKAYLQPGARDKLRNIAGVLNRYPQTNIQVVGHTDSRGSEESNLVLSRQRAEAVAGELSAVGVSRARMSIRGEGESRPVASNDTAEGRQQNRRVEINIIPEEGVAAQPADTPPPPSGYEPR